MSKTPEGDPGYLALLDEMRSLHTRKSAGYTGTDPDAWRNFRESTRWGVSPFVGALVRLSDKYLRVGSLVENAKHDQVGESIEDTLMDLAAYALIALCLYREQLGTDNRRRSSYQDVVRRMQPAYYSADDPAFSGSQMTQDVPEYESGTASQSEADPPSYPVAFPPPEPCAHPADQRYISVAGTENCHVCYQVLSEKRHLVKKDESFDEGCLHPQCIKTRHDDDPNFHEDWLGVFHEGPQKPVGSAGLWGDV